VGASCNKDAQRDPCLQPRNVSLRIQAQQRGAADTTATDTTLRGPVFIPIGGQQILKYSAGTSRPVLYLDPQSDSCTYFMRPDSLSQAGDTLRFRYTRKLQFLSNACGYTYFFSLQSVTATNSAIDSVRINNSVIDNDANSPNHLLLYFRKR
jgi:hypothetical protein